MKSIFINSHGEIVWFSIGMLAFAILFLIVGLLRVVEFEGLGLKPTLRKALVVGHILGCILFSASVFFVATDSQQIYRTLTTVLFFSALGFLFPIHIFIALKRRIRIKDHESSQT